MNFVAVIQARLSSSRLPNKVLLPVMGKPLLQRMLERVSASTAIERMVVATTTEHVDEPIVALCRELSVECYRGHPTDCLDRHFRVGLQTSATWVIKIPSDCPLIDPAVIDRVVEAAIQVRSEYDYISNIRPATWPDGNDVEVIAMRALSLAAAEAKDPFDREHTTPFLWSQPKRFRGKNVFWDTGRDCSRSHRCVVDWPEDYALVCSIFEQLMPQHGPCFPVAKIVDLLDRRPALRNLNARHHGYDYASTRRPFRSSSSKENPR